jgi:hypothetical protein
MMVGEPVSTPLRAELIAADATEYFAVTPGHFLSVVGNS